MAFDFPPNTSHPAAPVAGDVFGAYTWDGEKWTATAVTNPVTTAMIREKLTAARTYYVRKDGLDTNNGLANTAGGAFLTVAKALSVAAGLDCSIHQLAIQIGTGSYAEYLTLPPILGSSTPVLRGVDPTAVIQGCQLLGATVSWTVATLKVTNTLGGAHGFYVTAGALLHISGVEFGAINGGANHVYAVALGSVVFDNVNYTISGSANSHINAGSLGIITGFGYTVTLTGTPAFVNFAQSYSMGLIYIQSATFTGAATGTRYYSNYNSIINVGGGGVNNFPGNAAGSPVPPATQNGSYYLP